MDDPEMRQTDRAFSNIEAHPEGFNALARMYQVGGVVDDVPGLVYSHATRSRST